MGERESRLGKSFSRVGVIILSDVTSVGVFFLSDVTSVGVFKTHLYKQQHK